MAVDLSSVTHDASSLYTFVDSISTISEQASSSVYVKATEDFFTYISALADATKAYLLDFPVHLPNSDFLGQIYRQKLTIIRGCWGQLHCFVKAVREADTLNTPFSLLLTYYEKFHKLTALKNVRFAVFHLDEVNYQEIKADWISDLAGHLQSVIPNSPAFPADLGLIGIPYSQSSAVFLNALIPHEMGHFVFERLDISAGLQPEVVAAFDSATGSSSLASNERLWCQERLFRWAEEIFCDLFAIWMVGPAYSFAFIELFDLARIQPKARAREDLLFGPNHPADSYRLTQHMQFLGAIGWSKHIQNFKTHYIDVMDYVTSIDSSKYSFSSDLPSSLEPITLEAFYKLTPAVANSIQSLVGGLDAGVSDYAKYQSSIESYFHAGIVPSTFIRPSDDGSDTPEFDRPDPISVINVACKIHLESMQTLIALVGEDTKSVAAHSKWTRRLELWAAKAFEDLSLLNMRS